MIGEERPQYRDGHLFKYEDVGIIDKEQSGGQWIQNY